MKRLIVVLVALLAAWVGTAATATAAVVPTNSEVVHCYTYNSPAQFALVTHPASERGPPAAYDRATTHNAADRWSDGASVRPSGATTRASYDYDDPALLACADSTSGMTSEPAEVICGALSSLQRWRVAAKAVPETLSFGSRAAAREGLPGDLAAVGNRFFRGATGKSQDFQAVGLPGGGYRLQFFSPARNPGYGKLYVQEIDRSGNIISRYKDTIGPDGFIERKFVQ